MVSGERFEEEDDRFVIGANGYRILPQGSLSESGSVRFTRAVVPLLFPYYFWPSRRYFLLRRILPGHWVMGTMRAGSQPAMMSRPQQTLP